MTEKRYGEVPTSPVVMAACDSHYFIRFAPAFVASIAKNTELDIHIHVVNPTDEVFALACYLNSRVDRRVTYTFNDLDLTSLGKDFKLSNATNRPEVRAYYASLRFLVAPFILKHAQKIIILDIDCMAMKNFNFPQNYSVGYFPRKSLEGTSGWEQEGTKVAAGCVYFSSEAMNVCNAVSETLGGLPLQWFNDQIALNHVFSQIPDELCWKYDWTFMDWEFRDDTIIWTGKGPRKYDNPKYVAKQNEYHDLIMNNEYDKVVLAPRLDIPFKQFDIVREKTVNEPIREHWKNFIDKKIEKGHFKVESARWMFNSKIEKYFPNAKEILVPHVEEHNWKGGPNAYFYMQTVFPWLFTVDPLGWAGGASYVDEFDPNAEYSSAEFELMKEKLGKGKFGHLQKNYNDWNHIDKENYIIVPLQLPHDETIKYHSDFSVEKFVTKICEWAIAIDDAPQIVFKGHPVNLNSMKPLAEIIEKYRSESEIGFNRLLYITHGNFRELVESSQAMFVLNGGSGQEAMLLEKPVACFGRCDYATAVVQGNIEDVDSAWQEIVFDDMEERIELYKKWYHWYIKKICINVEK